jgi:predicted RNase H-like nuclease (RuvC/YqgF family)
MEVLTNTENQAKRSKKLANKSISFFKSSVHPSTDYKIKRKRVARPTKLSQSIIDAPKSGISSNLSISMKNDNSKESLSAASMTLEEIQNKLDGLQTDTENIQVDERKIMTNIKVYINLLLNMCDHIKPYEKIVSQIATSLDKLTDTIELASDNFYKIQNDKLIKKLKILSDENIQFYKQNEDLKKDVFIARKTIGYYETNSNIEKLFKEVSAKTEFIKKISDELQEFKDRESLMLEKISALGYNELLENFYDYKNFRCKRSQTFKVVPQLYLRSETLKS